MSLTYSRYLCLDELLELQQPRSEKPEHDEMLFIVIHQVYELWFKQILHELDRLAHLFETATQEEDHTPEVRHTLRRSLTILKTMVGQVDILETMTPISFNSFRTRLETASGFQSPQFRELEFFLGKRDLRMLAPHEGNPPALARIRARLGKRSLYQSFLLYLSRHGYQVPAATLEPAEGDASPPESEEIRAALLRVYREHDRLRQVSELMVDLDEGLQEWRYRHVKMVERTIGMKQGTGGSSGAAYLRGTLFQSLFPDLWAIRSLL